MNSFIEETRQYHSRQAQLLAEYPNAKMTVTSAEEHERLGKLLAEIDQLVARAALAATPAPAAPEGAGVQAQPWGDEPWEQYLSRQREKAQSLAAERDAAVLYGQACEQRRVELIEAAMRPLPSYDEIFQASTPPAAPVAGATR